MYDILNNVNGPNDIKNFSIEKLNLLASDIRAGLLNKLAIVGGHCSPNFGVVEMEIAMHYVFDSPIDKFVFDVSHQTYTHKMLTGRKESFLDETKFNDYSGFSNPEESVHDLFKIGHTSTSISLATGIAKARDQKGEKYNVVALIGDGSLSGGQALEGLNVAGDLNSNLIILVNDNQQSISETHGGMYKGLRELRESKGQSTNNIFKSFGLDYIYEENGNDIFSLINVFKKVKDIDHPIVVHINTVKGKGFKYAEENKEIWHFTAPFDKNNGTRKVNLDCETYQLIANKYILDRAEKDKDFVVITPNMPSSMALKKENREKLKDKYVDVGIAEEQAVSMASGMAKAGLKPLVITNTTFLQRAYDQISQDICINKSPVTMLLNFSSSMSLTDITHLGIFALPLFANIPNLIVLSPTSKDELVSMLDWSLDQEQYPVMILMPCNKVSYRPINLPLELNKYSVENKGEKVAILGLGDFYKLAENIASNISNKLGINATLINPRFASSIDIDLLESLKKDHKLVITLEDGVLDGGFGQKIASFYGDSSMIVKNYGLEKNFYDRYKPQELLNSQGITLENITDYVESLNL